MKRSRASSSVKKQLFLNCGRVDMYDMQEYAKSDLRLHHDPPFRETNHTTYEESYLISESNHIHLHEIESKSKEEYQQEMIKVKENKKTLEFNRKKQLETRPKFI